MKVQYLVTLPQVKAIDVLLQVKGTLSNGTAEGILVVEYDITSDQKSILDSVLSQIGSIVEDKSKKSQWPSKGDAYYYIDHYGDVECDHWETLRDGRPIGVDSFRRDIGNIFKTEEEAVFEIERLKVFNQLKNLSNDDQEWNNKNLHYHIVYEPYYNRLNVYESSCAKSPYICYFKTKESAEAVIEAIGKDKFKKYVFNVKE